MRNYQIAIQGTTASFHHLAAENYFGNDIELVDCSTFKEVCERISKNQADYGVMAIENSIAGSILLNYQLVETYELNIIGEVFLPIDLHLCVLPGTQLNEIKIIRSHPMALAQCQSFLEIYPEIELKTHDDTASAGKFVKEQQDASTGIIAGTAVANTYGLEILYPSIADVKQNYTRFYILSKGAMKAENPSKASVNIQLENEPGTLNRALSILANYNLNLSKIQSLPLQNKQQLIPFHLDIEFESLTQFNAALSELQQSIPAAHILGIYEKKHLSHVY
jgi:prephenate dehydratase